MGVPLPLLKSITISTGKMEKMCSFNGLLFKFHIFSAEAFNLMGVKVPSFLTRMTASLGDDHIVIQLVDVIFLEPFV